MEKITEYPTEMMQTCCDIHKLTDGYKTCIQIHTKMIQSQNQTFDAAIAVPWLKPRWKPEGRAENESPQERTEDPGECKKILYWRVLS